MTNLSDLINDALPYVPYVTMGAIATVGTIYWLRLDGARISEENKKLDEDLERIPLEQRGNVGQLLRDLRQGPSPKRAGYRIDHLLKKYRL